MGGTFFDTFSVEERQFFWERTETLVRALEEWAREYVCMRPVRVPLLALLTAMTSPCVPVPDAIGGAKIALWIFGIDDMADEREVSLERFRETGEQWCQSARDGTDSDDEGDELTAMLLEIRKDISGFRLFEPLFERWAFGVCRVVEAMVQEYRYALLFNAEGAQALPSLGEYLNEGLYSLGPPLWSTVLWITQDDPSVLEQIELIDAATRHASRATRLYNDLRTFDKETAEGNVNSVMIAYYKVLADQEVAVERGWAEAKRYILQLADFFGRECYTLLEQIHTESGQVEETLFRLVAFHSYFYIRREDDYHITSLADIRTLLVTGSD
jgi:hypothetical protein